MVPGADGHVVLVEDAGHVVRVDAVHLEADGAVVLRRVGVADDADVGQRRQTFHGGAHERLLARLQRVPADALEVAQRGGRRHDAGGVLRAGLELLGHGRPHGPFLRDRRDHLAAREERRHGLQQVELAPQHAHAEGPQRLVR